MNDFINNTLKAQKVEKESILRRKTHSREGLDLLRKQLFSPLVKVIVGPRRTGKSTAAFQLLAKEEFAYINFEDETLFGLQDGNLLISELNNVYPKSDFYLFDEIQNFPNWESFINKLHRRGLNLVITGSNSKLLSKELGASLTGRHYQHEILPLSFREISQTSKEDSERLFTRYLDNGGFPDICFHEAEPHLYITALFDSILLKDIVNRHKIRRPLMIANIAKLFLQSIGSKISYRSFERALSPKMNVMTIQKYISYLGDAYLSFELEPFFFKHRERMKADRKAYVIDNGFLSHITSSARGRKGQLLENLVFVELKRRGYLPNLDLFYFKTKSGFEVDFLTRKSTNDQQLIQVCLNLDEKKTLDREVRALTEAAKELNTKDLLILTLDESKEINQDSYKIRIRPVKEWILDV